MGVYNADNRGWDVLLADFEELTVKHNGRPHWGKEFNVDSDYLKSVYPKWGEFKKLRNELDPEGQFLNPMIEGLVK